MSASSSAASSTLLRPRTSIFLLTAVATALGIYYLHTTRDPEDEETGSVPGNGLHRSNAIHRRRRRNTESYMDATSPVLDITAEHDAAPIFTRPLTDGETVVDDQTFQEEFDFDGLQPPPSYQRNGQSVVQLLFRVSEDATRRNAYVHRGCGCNSCGVVPIRGIRYRCANCADYDLCENCEAQGLHIKTHIFYKVRVPAPAFGSKVIQSVAYSGDPDSVMRVLPKELITKLSRDTGFERPELDAYWEQWTFMANTDWRDDPDDIGLAMDRSTFERCLVPSGGYRPASPGLIFDRMFAFYDTNKDDLISFPEFLHGLAYRKKKDKWVKIFEGYDIDEDGLVDRKDFLRMFRSYYVLYRQMHRDMLEGMEDHQTSSMDAHRLVNSRQPLSSAFGQDGRYPPAPDIRTGEGKTRQANGDLQVNDGKGIMNESGSDNARREEIFTSLDLGYSFGEPHSYWRVLFDPPETMEDIPDIIRDILTDQRQIRGPTNATRLRARHSDSRPARISTHAADDSGFDSSSESDYVPPIEDTWPPTFVTITDEDVATVCPGVDMMQVGPSKRRSLIAHAVHRERVRREMHDRWKRRQFYTDEEEGATPPADWNDEEDILAREETPGESSKSHSQPHPSLHSRSSSKVRFAEDMDDFDTRSNPSTSSRSVPERWGGMEIPDAEKDVGKEILYQVTQQAFNELLDPLFKTKEDLAVEAAATKEERETYKALYTAPEFKKWALEKQTQEDQKATNSSKVTPHAQQHMWPGFPGLPEEEVELDDVRQRPLDALLAATGYRVELAADDSTRTLDVDGVQIHEQGSYQRSPRHISSSSPREPEAATQNRNIELAMETAPPQPPTSPDEAFATVVQPNNIDHVSADTTPPFASSPTRQRSASPMYRDPTLPQFRPDFAPLTEQNVLSLPPPSEPGHVWDFDKGPSSKGLKADTSKLGTQVDSQSSELPTLTPSKDQLFKYWNYDRAAKEAEERGGYGKLDFEEFETLVKKCVKEGKGNAMDYLGSWIEFCIP